MYEWQSPLSHLAVPSKHQMDRGRGQWTTKNLMKWWPKFHQLCQVQLIHWSKSTQALSLSVWSMVCKVHSSPSLSAKRVKGGSLFNMERRAMPIHCSLPKSSLLQYSMQKFQFSWYSTHITFVHHINNINANYNFGARVIVLFFRNKHLSTLYGLLFFLLYSIYSLCLLPPIPLPNTLLAHRPLYPILLSQESQLRHISTS